MVSVNPFNMEGIPSKELKPYWSMSLDDIVTRLQKTESARNDLEPKKSQRGDYATHRQSSEKYY